MKRRRPEQIEQDRQDQIAATDKARMWQKRARLARQGGREADAGRWDDKVRDWSSRARQIERRQTEDR